MKIIPPPYNSDANIASWNYSVYRAIQLGLVGNEISSAVSLSTDQFTTTYVITSTTAPRTVTIRSVDILEKGRIWVIKDGSGGAAANNITVATEGIETIDGANTLVINMNYGAVFLISDGTNLHAITSVAAVAADHGGLGGLADDDHPQYALTNGTRAITGAQTFNIGIVPDANDGAYLGQAGTAFSDLFLAEGGVINWDSGDATLTQVGNMVTLAGADLTTPTVYATTFDTNVAAAGVTLTGTTLAADGTDANIDINITPKGALGDLIVTTAGGYVKVYDSTAGYIKLGLDQLVVGINNLIGGIAFEAKDTDTQGGAYLSVAYIACYATENYTGAATAGSRLDFATNIIGTETPDIHMSLDGQVLKIDHIAEYTAAHTTVFDTNVTINGGFIDNTPIGATTEAGGYFNEAAVYKDTGAWLTLALNDTSVLSGDLFGGIQFQAKDTDTQGGVYAAVATIEAYATENYAGAATAGSKLAFRTNPIGTEALAINMELNGIALKIDHIAELTGAHTVVFDNDVTVPNLITAGLVDGIDVSAIGAASHTQNTDTGTTGNTFTVDSDSVLGKMVLDVALGAADWSLTLTNTALTANHIATFQNATGTVAYVADIAVDANLSAAAQAVVTAGACDIDANLSAAAQAVITAGPCDIDANLSVAAQAAVAASHTQNTDAGTTGNTFTVDSDSALGKMVLDVALGAADWSLTLTNTVLTGNRIATFQNVTGTVAYTADIAVDANLSAAAQAVITAGACDLDANLSVAAQAVITAGACDVDVNLSAAAQAAITASHSSYVVGTKTVDETDIGDTKILQYNAATGKLEYENLAAGHAQNTDTGTTGNTFTIDSDSATGKIILDVALGAADKSLTLTNTALTADRVATFQDASGIVAYNTDIVPCGGFEFSIAGANLTITAKGKTILMFPSATTPGLLVPIDLTGYSYTFDTDSYPVNASCGITATRDWANPMPWFVYLGNEDNTAANVFAFNTRNPGMSVTPAVGLINDTTAIGATAQSQNHINSWKADDAGIAAKPCICIGSHTMTWETDVAPVADVWELVALTTADGFGKFQEGVQFTFPVGQNGNQAAKIFNVTDGATALAFGTYEPYYWIDRKGMVTYAFDATNCSADGADAVALRFYLPYSAKVIGAAGGYGGHLGTYWASGDTTAEAVGIMQIYDAAPTYGLIRDATSGNALNDDSWGVSAGYHITGRIIYPAF